MCWCVVSKASTQQGTHCDNVIPVFYDQHCIVDYGRKYASLGLKIQNGSLFYLSFHFVYHY